MPTSKIEKWGLQKRIEDLIAAGTRTSAAISDALKKEGFDVSQPTIARHLKFVRETRREETQKIVQDHIQKTVPKDLNALETMEGQCLTNAQEDISAFAHRLAARKIAEQIDSWIDRLSALNAVTYPDPKELRKAKWDAAEAMMDQCIRWVVDDYAFQKNSRGAMRQATQIIGLKLQYSGIIGADQEGNIFLVKKGELKEDPTTGRLIVLRGGQAANAEK